MKYLILLFSCSFLLFQCSADLEDAVVSPQQLEFIGSGSGCVNFFVFKLNEDKNIGLTVTGIKDALELNQDLKTFDLATEQHLMVNIDKWANDMNTYCTDVVEAGTELLNSYESISGTVKVQIVEDSIIYSGANAFPELLYKIDVHLENILLQDNSGEELSIPNEKFSDVLVGWFPG